MINKISTRLRQEYGGQKYFLICRAYQWLQKLGLQPSTQRYVRANSVHRVVFVCKGNICRSAFAHQYFHIRIPSYAVASFGLLTKTGLQMNDKIQKNCAQYGVNRRAHQSTSMQDFNHDPADLYLCMEPYQLNQIRRHWPTAHAALLGDFLSKPRPYFPDPYATNDEYVARSVDLLKEAVDNLIDTLVN